MDSEDVVGGVIAIDVLIQMMKATYVMMMMMKVAMSCRKEILVWGMNLHT